MSIRVYPLAAGTFKISSGFGNRPGGFHAGLDFAANAGTPFYACQAGTVQYIGAADGYGQWIVIDSDDSQGGGCVEYGHMWNAAATGLRVGARVQAGQLIGFVGSNGQSSGPHLHISVWPRGYGDGSKIDPAAWLKSAGNPSTKPAPSQPSSESGGATVSLGIPYGKYRGWTGDPVWLPEVLRAAGLPVVEHEGWRDRGHGDFGLILGVICHHTAGGGSNDWRIVQNGRPDLPGPLSQLVLEKDGTYRIIAAGVCWHAGRGSWPGWPTNNANYQTIGIEAVSRGTAIGGQYDWTDIQLRNYKIGCAAIMNALGRRAA